jgi:hypothetical protein
MLGLAGQQLSFSETHSLCKLPFTYWELLLVPVNLACHSHIFPLTPQCTWTKDIPQSALESVLSKQSTGTALEEQNQHAACHSQCFQMLPTKPPCGREEIGIIARSCGPKLRSLSPTKHQTTCGREASLEAEQSLSLRAELSALIFR